MKKFYNYTFRTVCIFILVMTLYSITIMQVVTKHNRVDNLNEKKVVSSSLIYREIKESINVNNEVSRPIVNVNTIDTSGYNVITSEIVNISHFGPDCSGCGNYVASGYYVGNGRIYYNDPTFGGLRIVAADKKYPLGTVVRLNYRGQNVVAIVLDRGWGIGDINQYQIDLLTTSEAKASQEGVIRGAKLEVLRLGY